MTLSVTTLTRLEELEAIELEWEALFVASSAPNPFALPRWLITWALHFVPEGRLRVVTVRSADGELVGVAPFYLDLQGSDRLGTSRLRHIGARNGPDLTEMQQVLARPGHERAVLRAVLRHCLDEQDGWDWLELVLTPEQGWLEPQWIDADRAFILHKASWASVVLPLCVSWDTQRAALKRNARESIRRSENRLRSDARSWVIDHGRSAVEIRDHIATLVRLHGERSALADRESHQNAFSHERDRGFLRDSALALAARGHLETLVLRTRREGPREAAREDAAALLTLFANDATFISASGLAPACWSLGAGTALVAEALRRAIDRGDRQVNFSSGPDRAKLRWSERLTIAQEFVIVRRGARRRLGFTAYWLGRAARQINTEATWHRRR